MIAPPEAVVGQSIRKWALRLAQYLHSERILAGSGVLIKQTNGGRTLSVVAIQFSGVADVRGVKTIGLDSDARKPWIAVDVSAGTATQVVGPPPNPFPDGVEYYEKAQTAGDIHVSRFG